MKFFSFRLERRDKSAWTYQEGGLKGQLVVKPTGECYGYAHNADDAVLLFVQGYLDEHVDAKHGGIILLILSNNPQISPQIVTIPAIAWQRSSEGKLAEPSPLTGHFTEAGIARISLTPVHGEEYLRRQIDQYYGKLDCPQHQKLLEQLDDFPNRLREATRAAQSYPPPK